MLILILLEFAKESIPEELSTNPVRQVQRPLVPSRNMRDSCDRKESSVAASSNVTPPIPEFHVQLFF